MNLSATMFVPSRWTLPPFWNLRLLADMLTGMSERYAAFRHAGYRSFTAWRLLSVIGNRMSAAAVAWQIYEISGSPLHLGMIGLVQILPVLVLAPWAGQLADRLPRGRILLFTHGMHLLCALLYAFLSTRASLPGFYAVLLLSGVARAFQGPAAQALMPALVPREHFPNAVGWRLVVFESCSILGPVGAGFLLGSPTGALGAHLLNAALAAAAFGPLLAVPRVAQAPAEGGGILEGFRYVWRRREILGGISLDLFAVLFGGAEALLPVFARDILHVGPEGYGFLRAASSAGSVAMSMLLLGHAPFERAGRTLFATVAAYGLAMVAFGLSTDFWLSLMCLAASGMADAVSVVIRHTIVQTLTPDGMRGRVSAVNGVFFGASNELGEFESGIAAVLLGAGPSVVFGGLMTLAITAWHAARFPELRKLGRLAVD